MTVLVYFAYFIAGLIIPNGLLHFFHGIIGKKIPHEYFPVSRMRKKTLKERGRPSGGLFGRSYGFNTIWGLLWIIAAFLILNLVGKFNAGVSWDTGTFFLGLLIGSYGIGKGWNDYEKRRDKA